MNLFSIKNLSSLCLLITALVLSTCSIYIIYYKKTAGQLEDTEKPDAFMEEVVATVMNKKGDPTLSIISPKMIHYVKNDVTEITKPLLTLYQKSPQPWHLTAEHAKALQGIDQILLWENVIIDHPGDHLSEKTTLLTPTLTIYPEKQLASTADPVVITQPNAQIHAVGMNADLASGTVKLLSQTRGEYRVQE